jgi:MFS family permease
VAAVIGAQLFGGMSNALYSLVAFPLISSLTNSNASASAVPIYGACTQAASLVGWAVGGTLLGCFCDRIGRSRALWVSVVICAMATGLCCVAQTWWHLLLLRFLGGIGVGGQGAAGSALIAEVWPGRARPWLSASLQAAATAGNFLAAWALGVWPGGPQSIFAIGFVPLALALWVSQSVPEPEEWHRAQATTRNGAEIVGLADIFRGPVLRTTLIAGSVCLLALTILQSSLFWVPQYLRSLVEFRSAPLGVASRYVSEVVQTMALAAIGGSFIAASLAHRLGARQATVLMMVGGFVAMLCTYGLRQTAGTLRFWLPMSQLFIQGVFGILLLHLPALYPTRLRATGAGFCLNSGRVVAAAAIVLSGVGVIRIDYREVLFAVSFLALPALVAAALLPAAVPPRIVQPPPQRDRSFPDPR